MVFDRLIIDSKNSSKNPEMSSEVEMTSESKRNFSSYRYEICPKIKGRRLGQGLFVGAQGVGINL